jgi:hypothetical protein
MLVVLHKTYHTKVLSMREYKELSEEDLCDYTIRFLKQGEKAYYPKKGKFEAISIVFKELDDCVEISWASGTTATLNFALKDRHAFQRVKHLVKSSGLCSEDFIRIARQLESCGEI